MGVPVDSVDMAHTSSKLVLFGTEHLGLYSLNSAMSSSRSEISDPLEFSNINIPSGLTETNIALNM